MHNASIYGAILFSNSLNDQELCALSVIDKRATMCFLLCFFALLTVNNVGTLKMKSFTTIALRIRKKLI